MATDLPPALKAELTSFGESPVASPVTLTALTGKLLTLDGAPLLATGSAVKVREGDRLWLGEVIECRPNGFAVVEIVHYLKNVQDLSTLAERFYGRRGSEIAPSSTATVS
jgi:hypothetical protein